EKPSSGKSHSVTMHKPVHCRLVREETDLQVYTLSGTPADCIKFGIHSLLKRKPDLVISGINHGTNSSVSVVYSGTMAAAIEGCLNRVSSVGFSLTDYQQTADFSAAEKYAEIVIEKV
ncbi:MAG TPA: 5'/3'-nucleotidase SurE, partial [Bacteroidales bacterium]|nr:5'/3'-nucleotidase SurE [Bacteroidales bacterium]